MVPPLLDRHPHLTARSLRHGDLSGIRLAADGVVSSRRWWSALLESQDRAVDHVHADDLVTVCSLGRSQTDGKHTVLPVVWLALHDERRHGPVRAQTAGFDQAAQLRVLLDQVDSLREFVGTRQRLNATFLDLDGGDVLKRSVNEKGSVLPVVEDRCSEPVRTRGTRPLPRPLRLQCLHAEESDTSSSQHGP